MPKGRRSRRTNDYIDVKKSGPEQWDSILYHHPEKLNEPCARIESDGEWFPIDRVLDSIYVVGTDKMWQHLVHWKPCWSRQVTPSALRDFHAQVTVLGCVVKEDVLKSRARQRIEWNRREFMCSNFAVRITDPDGTTTVEIIPYPDVKRRFPNALFEFFERKMPYPRVRDEDKPRTDGLLSLYNDINIPQCVYLDPDAPKPEEVQESTKNERGNSAANSPSKNSVTEAKKRNKRNRYYKGRWQKGRSRTARGSSHNGSRQSLEVSTVEERASSDVHSPADVMNNSTSSNEVKNVYNEMITRFSPPPGISPSSAKEFLNNLQNMQKLSPKKAQNLAVVAKSPKSPTKTSKKLDPNTLSPKIKNLELDETDDVVFVGEKNENHSEEELPQTKASGRKSLGSHSNDRRSSKENSAPKIGSPKTPPAVKRTSPRLSSNSNSGKRISSEGKSRGFKRNAPLRSRNSLDNYFTPSNSKHRRVSGDENGPKLDT